MFCIARFKDIEKQEYECEVVTPLFLGGANPKEAELRAPSIKAAMRFWWRALYGQNDVKDMSERESELFGSTEKKAAVSVMVNSNSVKSLQKDLPVGEKIMVTSKGKTFPISIVEYLAFGLFDPKLNLNKYLREYIESGSKFKLIVTYPKNAASDIEKTLKAMISFGGLGSRSRNGFGSLYCDPLIDQTVKKEGELKDYTSFSKEAKIFNNFNKYKKWEQALSEIGKAYRAARLTLEDRHKFNKRGLIAMPIESKFETIPQFIKNGRHAKPYFLHVNKTSDGQYQGQILFLPYKYKASPDDKVNQSTDYLEVCRKMNDAILWQMGGAK